MAVRSMQLDMIEDIVDNPDIVAQIPELTSDIDDEEIVEYLIITNEALKPSFQPLADWKHKKGVRSRIATVEEIYQQYSELGDSVSAPMKIKSYIKDLWQNHGLMYILLGGDVDIVPTQPCYINMSYFDENGNLVKRYVHDDFPTDVYYACPEDLNWDTNNDGKNGNPLNDNIDIVPAIYISRIPVRNSAETAVIVNRTIEYEQNPRVYYEMLQLGTELDESINGKLFANTIFNNVINNKIRIQVNQAFSPEIPFTSLRSTLTNALNSGCHFLEVICHGKEDSWCNSNTQYFNAQHIASINNPGYTLITTTACFTNAFDWTDVFGSPRTCLSEAFIKSPQSGIIGYIGSSREGWYHNQGAPDFSTAYEMDLCERIFNLEMRPYDKHLGALLCHSKLAWLGLAETSFTYRWLHYSINAIGDPETIIYNRIPSQNTSANATALLNQISITSGTAEALVCVSSADDNDFYSVHRGSNNYNITAPSGTYDVWITAQNYLPKHFSVNVNVSNPVIPDTMPLMINKLISITPNPASTTATIKYQRGGLANAVLSIAITSINGGSVYNYELDNGADETTIDVSNLPNGIYIVTLLEDGIATSSSLRLVKQ